MRVVYLNGWLESQCGSRHVPLVGEPVRRGGVDGCPVQGPDDDRGWLGANHLTQNLVLCVGHHRVRQVGDGHVEDVHLHDYPHLRPERPRGHTFNTYEPKLLYLNTDFIWKMPCCTRFPLDVFLKLFP